ncbi:class I adenylate-forming enzyme family protein [Ammoniphilus sp. YIM 78166]|uniref:class I adenylate-forming enzyme family protein n=1 Tax=Ammoniphilus sp. YIM 78166 TaxID=1644106 RepID=UPI00106FA7E8|nr:long-chain fatty acid--CoA ligase [Ammoniphilus sp. YIM 78166]
MIWETDWLSSRARLTPDKEAVVEMDSGGRWTYRELDQRVAQAVRFLQDHGIGKGERVALLAPNHISCLELLFACGRLGAVFVPLNTRLGASELDYILEDCQPKLLFCHPSLQEGIQAKIPIVSVEAYLSGEPGFSGATIDLQDPYLIIYTGGTTGRPKGVVLSHKNVFWNSVNTIVSWGIAENDITVTYLPMFHTGGLNALSLPILHMGGKVVIGSKFQAEEAVQTIEKEQCTIILLVPTMYHMMIATEDFKKASFQSVHTFLSGGAPCPHSIYEPFEKRGLRFKEGYGLTEAGPNNFFIHPEDVKKKRGSVGKPMFHSMVKIVKENGEEAAPHEVGELYIQGHHVFEHYFNKPEETQEAKQDGWLRTGDLAKRDEDGYHYIVGRKKDMIITGGENVYPQEIEHLLDQHPSVHEVVVLGLPDPKWGEVVTAAIVVKAGMSLLEREVLDYVSAHLGKYKVPKKVYFVEELLKTPIGKIDRKEMAYHLQVLL